MRSKQDIRNSLAFAASEFRAMPDRLRLSRDRHCSKMIWFDTGAYAASGAIWANWNAPMRDHIKICKDIFDHGMAPLYGYVLYDNYSSESVRLDDIELHGRIVQACLAIPENNRLEYLKLSENEDNGNYAKEGSPNEEGILMISRSYWNWAECFIVPEPYEGGIFSRRAKRPSKHEQL